MVAGGFWFIYRNRQPGIQNQPKILTAAVSKTADENPDSDRDGLKDWEERLWGTNPNNPDTDGDGAPDGQEIKLGRNPLKPPPDSLDATQSAKKRLPDESNAEEKKSTLSADIARNFFSDYVSLKNQGHFQPSIMR